MKESFLTSTHRWTFIPWFDMTPIESTYIALLFSRVATPYGSPRSFKSNDEVRLFIDRAKIDRHFVSERLRPNPSQANLDAAIKKMALKFNEMFSSLGKTPD